MAKVGEQVRTVRDLFGGRRDRQAAPTTRRAEHDFVRSREALSSASRLTLGRGQGWRATLKGHVDDLSGLTFKTDGQARPGVFAEKSTRSMLAVCDQRKFYRSTVAKCRAGADMASDRMFVDMEQECGARVEFVNKGESKSDRSSEGQASSSRPPRKRNRRKHPQGQKDAQGNDDGRACAITTLTATR